MQNIFIEFLPPWVETGLQPAFYDKESGTILQQVSRMYAKINELVGVANKQNTIIEEYIKKFIDLKDYVDDYFENLDVQEEINNKLDDMAESGDLQVVIAQFLALAPVFGYDTLADLVASDYLNEGCIAKTLGKTTINDGLGAYYRIDETGDIALNNGLYATKVSNDLNKTLTFNTLGDLVSAENIEEGYTAITLGKETANDGYGAVYTIGDVGDIVLDSGLYATLINNYGNNYYDEITLTSGRANSTDYYLATIPLNDDNGDLIPCYVYEGPDYGDTPLQYADNNFTTLTLNAGLGRQDSNSLWKQGAIIANGVINHEDLCDIPAPNYYSYIGIKADRSVHDYSGNTTAEQMLADGVVNAFLTFGLVVTNGSLTINEHWDDSGNNPLVYLGVKNDGTMLIFACDGRTKHDTGFTIQEGASFMLAQGCNNVWRLDGGGSTSMVYKGSKQNRNIDEHGTKDRGIWVTLNFKKETIDKQLAEAFSYIGKERQLLNKQIRDDVEATYSKQRSFVSYMGVTTGRNVIADADTKIPVNFNNNYRHGDAIETIRDENNLAIGFRVTENGIYEVVWTQDVYCKSTAGMRAIRIEDSTGNQFNYYSTIFDYMTPTANNEYHALTGVFSYVLTAGTELYFKASGQVGDDFCRANVTINQIGVSA